MKLLTLLLVLAGSSQAHDLALRVEQVQPAVIVYATYAGVEPVTDADVTIFSPQNAESPFQTGITDVRGVFAFVPSEPGDWRIVDDGFGHRFDQTIAVDWQSAPVNEHGGGGATWANAILGVSIIFGFTGILLWLKSRERTGAP